MARSLIARPLAQAPIATDEKAITHLEDESGEPDWDAFDSPTFDRKGGT